MALLRIICFGERFTRFLPILSISFFPCNGLLYMSCSSVVSCNTWNSRKTIQLVACNYIIYDIYKWHCYMYVSVCTIGCKQLSMLFAESLLAEFLMFAFQISYTTGYIDVTVYMLLHHCIPLIIM